jgi:hypothetical protein
MTCKYEKGEKIKVQGHKINIGNVEVRVESFVGTFIREHVDNKGKKCADVYGEGKAAGYRVVPLEFVVPLDEDDNLEFDGDYYVIRCECGKKRKIKPQHVKLVTRCKKCQRERDKELARKRSRRPK